MTELWNRILEMLAQYGIIRILLAILVLFAGWIVAWILRGLTHACMRKSRIGERLTSLVSDDSGMKKPVRAERIAGGIVFWIVFLIALVQALNILSLHEAAEPLRNVLGKITGYLPNLLAAGVLALIAWGVAAALRYASLVLMHALHVDERIERSVDTGGKECNLSYTVATALFWLVILAFVPAILGALEITGLERPFEAMTADVLRYLPHIFAAVLIMIAGVFLATVLKKLAEQLVSGSAGLQDAEETGGKLFSRETLATICGALVFACILIPATAAALSALGIDALSGAVSKLFTRMLNSAGNVAGAAIVLFAAFALGAIAARLVARLLADAGLDKRLAEYGWNATGKGKPSAVAGKLLFLGILVFALISALEIMQLEESAKLVRSFLPFAGRLVLGAIVFLLGMMLADLASDCVRRNGWESPVFAFAVRMAVLFFAGVAALTTAGIGGTAALLAFGIVLGAFAVAFAIAFGLGGRSFAERRLEEWEKKFPKKADGQGKKD